MRHVTTAVVGGGASGIAAAIAAKRRGDDVVLLEKTRRLGRKILASGNGRCNLLNEHLNPSVYNKAARHLVKSVLGRFGKDDIAAFFAGLGVSLYADRGRVFPVTNQSASVLRSLELELARNRIPIELEFDVAHIAVSGDIFTALSRSGKKISAERLIIATGGRSYPSFGSDGSGYALARHFAHTVIAPVPSAVPLDARDPLCQPLQGQKIFARARAVIGGSNEAEAEGEILFTKYGLSGTAILDISRPISVAINRSRRKDVAVVIDLIPYLSGDALREELARRLAAGWPPDDILTGILPNKFGPALRQRADLKDPGRAAGQLKGMRFAVTGTRGWNEADFTAGGVAASEVREDTLESKLRRGLYFCGEILDVDGCRGGYNLAWAWSSGHVAGLTGHDA